MNALRQQIRSMLRVEQREGGFRAVFAVGHDLMVLPDHFRESPILPGICMVQAILIAGASARGVEDLRLTRLKNAKLMQPVQPGDELVIDADMIFADSDELVIKAKLFVGEQRRAEFSLTARPAVAAGDRPRPPPSRVPRRSQPSGLRLPALQLYPRRRVEATRNRAAASTPRQPA